MTENNSIGIRLNKYISETGYCSRREADKLIEQGKVLVNGRLPALGTKIHAGDDVKVNGKRISAVHEQGIQHAYIAFNKPVGITCTTELHVRGNIIDYIHFPSRIFPIGRLDKDSEGLIFLTSDGDIVNKILRAGNNHEKEYVVTVDRPIRPEFTKQMGNGVEIFNAVAQTNVVTQKCPVKQIGPNRFNIILTQGLNRQIRRMCEALGYSVVKLKRIRIMHVTLDGLPIGEWRNLTPAELPLIMDQTSQSNK